VAREQAPRPVRSKDFKGRDGTGAMAMPAKPASSAAPAWVYLRRARDAVAMAAAALPRTQLSAEAREEYTLEVATLMGRLDLLLVTLRQRRTRIRSVAAPETPGHREGRATSWRVLGPALP
jgi:hypothetical protein